MRINKQISLFSVDKTQEALEFIRTHEPHDGYFVAFSGGKDSQVVYDLVKRSGVKYQAYYSATGIDPPELTRFIRRHYPEVIWCRPKKTFFKHIHVEGMPTMFRRWCCRLIKKQPTMKIPLNHRIVGIRAEESSKRASRGNISKHGKQILYKPIFTWLEWEIWEYIDKHNILYCSLYDEGFDRIGCVVCPFICRQNSKQIERNRQRWPKFYTAFEKAMRVRWDTVDKVKNHERGYHSVFSEYLQAWYDAAPKVKADNGQKELFGGTER